MAEVYLVLAEGPAGFNKLQVLKLMRSDLSEQERPDFLRMFQDEARLAARLNHPNIVQSHEVGDENGQPFIVMEYLDGQPLSRVQQRARSAREQFPLEMELSVLCQVLEALEYAHGLTDYDGTPLHIVHRDVSPQNVFITYAGQTKLVDFGVAKTLESSKTRAGVVKGKVAYMSPEQVRGGPVDHRADLFSVGVLLWETIAGQAMYADLSVYESLNRLVRGDLPRIRDFAPDVAEELEQILARALATSPDERYADADEFRADLLGYVDSLAKVRPRAVGEQVARLFARERSDVNQVIRRALSAGGAAEVASEDFQLTRIVPDFGSSPGFVHDVTTPMRHTTPVPRTSMPPTAAQAAASNPSPPRSARTSRLWLGGLLGAGALTAIASLAWTMRSSGASVQGAEVGSLTASPTSAAEQALVKLYIEAEPRHAALVLDGVRLGANPYEGRMARDGRAHTLEVSAPGHKALRTNVQFDGDVRLQLQLAELAAAEPPRDERRSGRVEPKVQPAAAAVARDPRERSARKGRTRTQPDDPYEELAPPKPVKLPAPELDRSDPWAPEQTR
jgi:serine/threonine-protein kinase